MGRDSDDPRSADEVGRAGVAIDTLADFEDLFAGIDMGAITTSMTINSPAPIALAMYLSAAEKRGTPRAGLGGTLQNDILKEYQAQKEFVFPPRPSVRLVADVIRFCAAEMPRWHPVSVSGTTSARPGRPPPRSWPSPWPTVSPTPRPPSPPA